MSFLAFVIALAFRRLPAASAGGRRGLLSAYAHLGLRVAGPAAGMLRGPLALLWALLPGMAGIAATAGLAGGAAGWLRVAVLTALAYVALGAGDLRREVLEYRVALSRNDADALDRIARQVGMADTVRCAGMVGEGFAVAVFVASSNRLFGVLFWFVALGPLGPAAALAFRVTDLQRRAATRGGLAQSAASGDGLFWQRLHGALAFLPARLTALSYGVAGSFEESFAGWGRYLAAERRHFFDANDGLVAHAGRGALGARWDGCRDEGERAAAALGLVDIATLLWLAAFALVTLLAWIA